MSTINVLYYISDFGTGGAERQVIELLKRLDRDRFSPSVCVSTFWGPLADELFGLQEDGIPIRVLPRSRTADFWFLVRLVQLLRTKRVHILHTYIFSANWRGVIAGRLAGVPIIVSSERTASPPRRRVYETINRMVMRCADRMVVNSRAGASWLMRDGHDFSDRVVIVPNGVEVSKFKGVNVHAKKKELGLLDGQEAVVGLVAGFRPPKDHQTFFRAAALVRERYPQARFLCIGENGRSSGWARDLVKTLGLAESVIFLGEREDVEALVCVLDIGVLSSAWEGLPNSILEYMAAGKPVVATNVGGCPELVLDGETGFLVPPGDPERMAAAIISLLSDRDMARRMGHAGLDRVKEHFSMEACVNATYRLYEDLIEEKLRK